jgi:hypothetical protein
VPFPYDQQRLDQTDRELSLEDVGSSVRKRDNTVATARFEPSQNGLYLSCTFPDDKTEFIARYSGALSPTQTKSTNYTAAVTADRELKKWGTLRQHVYV